MGKTLPVESASRSGNSVPKLEPGDRLTRAEFERRYEAMSECKKAELLEGIVYMPSPVSQKKHSMPQTMIIGWLYNYWESTLGVEPGTDTTLRLDLDNEPQPDAILYIDPKHGGQVQIDGGGFIVGAPELTVEVSSSSVSYDLHVKLDVYRRAGVKEYLVWRVNDGALDWFVSVQGAFKKQTLGADGIYRSPCFPGLWLNAKAMLALDKTSVKKALQAGLASKEHAAFIKKLAKAAT